MSMPEQTPKSRPRRVLGRKLAGVMLALAVLAGLISAAAAQASSAPAGSAISLVAANSSGCASSSGASGFPSYQTVVTEHAGDDNGLPELFTDKVTLSWCTDGSGHVQILSSSQAPSVQASGFSFSGAEIALLNTVGITFGVTPATAPVPAIDNEPSYASTTASGLSFNESLDLGQDLVALAGSYIGGAITDRLAAEACGAHPQWPPG